MLRGIHVFWGIVAFFGMMLAVQGFFVVQAVRTFPGEEVEKSYVQGIDYNQTLERRDLQRRLGWSARAGLEDNARLVVRLGDASDKPLRGLSVTASVRRLGGGERKLTLVERRPGEYAAEASATRGRLQLAIEARRSGRDEVIFEAIKTLEVE
jgi:nitrogen fixation protein FixH